MTAAISRHKLRLRLTWVIVLGMASKVISAGGREVKLRICYKRMVKRMKELGCMRVFSRQQWAQGAE